MNLRKTIKIFIPKKLFKTIEPTGHLVEAVFFNIINGFPFRGLKVIGVTGTNGKTTTCFMIHSILRAANINTGLMTTVAYGVNDQIKPQMHHMTTVSAPELMRRVKKMKKEGIDYLILETTSHALAQNRVWGVPYSVSVLTNMTHEHISYHGSFENYVLAKLKLFKLTNKNKNGLKFGIINGDDKVCDKFASTVDNKLIYGLEHGALTAKNIQLSEDKSVFDINFNDQKLFTITCNIPGSFNVYNTLAAVGVGRVLGIFDKYIIKGIESLKSVEGRMTNIDMGQNFRVIVDYAHTPDSFEKLFQDIRPLIKNRIITVFGSLGGGDVAKRAEQGRISGKYADIVILTEEDNRKENGQKIIDDIAKGCLSSGKKLSQDLFFISKREEAIQEAINLAQKDDLVLLLGKGHEKTIEHADGEHPWNEIEQAKIAIKHKN